MSSFRRDDEPEPIEGAEPSGLPREAFEPSLDLPGISSVEDPSLWDVVTTAETRELGGETYEFVALHDGSLIVDDSTTESLSVLADALEEHMSPPYRALGMRQAEGLWTVCARRIQIIQLAAAGDELELSSVGNEVTFTVDEADVDASLAPAELAALGEACGDDYAVHASRLDGDLWEVTADPL